MSDNEPQPVTLPSVESTAIFKNDILKGKVVFATGASGPNGICYGMVLALMRHGMSACIMGRKADKLQATAKQMEKDAGNGTKCIFSAGDVRKPEDMKTAVAKTIESYGKIDNVICGAAGNFLAPIEGISENGFKTVMEIDLLGTYNTIKATMDHLKKTRGSYLHVSATLQYTGIPWQSAASSAKAGVDALSQVLAVEMGPLGVRSNVVAPGMIGGTEGADRLSMKGAQDAIASTLPLQKVGKPSDIANICVYLFSEAGNWITGSKFVVDGGGQHFPGPWLPYPQSSLDPKGLKELITGSKL